MLDQQALTDLATEIRSQGFDQATAFRYSALIGDTPIYGDHGRVLVWEDRRVIAELQPLKFFDVSPRL